MDYELSAISCTPGAAAAILFAIYAILLFRQQRKQESGSCDKEI